MNDIERATENRPQRLAERLWHEHAHGNANDLGELIHNVIITGETISGLEYDESDIENLHGPDVDNVAAESLLEILDDENIDVPEVDIYAELGHYDQLTLLAHFEITLPVDEEKMDEDLEWVGGQLEAKQKEIGAAEFVRACLATSLDISNWEDEAREAIRDHYNENPPEVYEWWFIDEWLADKLSDAGEVVIHRDYGYDIWGRQGTGQATYMDHVIRKLAREDYEKFLAPDTAEPRQHWFHAAYNWLNDNVSYEVGAAFRDQYEPVRTFDEALAAGAPIPEALKILGIEVPPKG